MVGSYLFFFTQLWTKPSSLEHVSGHMYSYHHPHKDAYLHMTDSTPEPKSNVLFLLLLVCQNCQKMWLVSKSQFHFTSFYLTWKKSWELKMEALWILDCYARTRRLNTERVEYRRGNKYGQEARLSSTTMLYSPLDFPIFCGEEEGFSIQLSSDF